MGDARELALRMVALRYAEQLVGPKLKELRQLATDELVPKESIAAISPVDGTVLGKITRTNPEKVAVVEDEQALMAHLQDTDPDSLEDTHEVTASDEQIVHLLLEHAPHLLVQSVRIRDYARRDAMSRALAGKPVPGVKVKKPFGTVNVYPDQAEAAAIEAVFKAGRLQLDGAVVQAIEAATEGDQ